MGSIGASRATINRREEDIKSTPLIFGTAVITDTYIDIDGYSNKKTEAGALSDLAKALDKYDKGEADALRGVIGTDEMMQITPGKNDGPAQYILEWEEVPSASHMKENDEMEYKPAKWYLHTRIVR